MVSSLFAGRRLFALLVCFVLFSSLFFSSLRLYAQLPPPPDEGLGYENCIPAGVESPLGIVDQPGGTYISSTGTLRCVVVFAEFPDDGYDTTNSRWVKGQPPAYMGQWIDSVASSTPTPGSLTDYFYQMSMGQFTVIGDCYHVIAPHNRKWYVDSSYNAGKINRDVLTYLDTQYNGSGIDFAKYDNWSWTTSGEYNHTNQPDNGVDFVWVIWRNTAQDLKTGVSTSTTPSFEEWDNAKTDFEQLAWSQLGTDVINLPLVVDGGLRRIGFSYGKQAANQPDGAGATVSSYLPATELNSLSGTISGTFIGSIHEFAHWLLPNVGCTGGHGGKGFWAMLNNATRLPCANTWERHRLGWISATTVDNSACSSAPYTFALGDYVTTGDAIRIKTGAQSFLYLENHQNLSRWDKSSGGATIVEPGVYVLQQADEIPERISMLSAKGRYDWNYEGKGHHPFHANPFDSLPVFSKGAANRHGGFSDNHAIAYNPPGSVRQTWTGVVLEKIGSVVHVGLPEWGSGKDAFRFGYNEILSPWSNPPSEILSAIPFIDSTGKKECTDSIRRLDRIITNTGFRLISYESGMHLYYVMVYCNAAHAQQGQPALVQDVEGAIQNTHPRLEWQANEEPDLAGYKIYRAVKNCNPGITPADSEYSLIVSLNSGSITQWMDSSITYESCGLCQCQCAWYKLVARDTQNLESLPQIRRITTRSGSICAAMSKDDGREEEAREEDILLPMDEDVAIRGIYPTPSAGTISVDIESAVEASAELLITDIRGQSVYSGSLRCSKGRNTLSLSLPQVSGMYLLRISVGTSMRTQAFYILN